MKEHNKLKNLFKLSSRITLYIPATKNVDEKFDNKKYVDEAASLLSECFGGSTSTPALGYWLSKNKGLIKEATDLVFAYCTDLGLQKNIEKIIDFCEYIKSELSQEAVSLEINGEMYFI